MAVLNKYIQTFDPRLKALGVVAGFLLAGSVYINIRRTRKDKKAASFLIELKREIKPSSAGLLANNAFDIAYLDQVLQKVKASVVVLTPSAANRFAKQVKDAWGFWNDDEDAIYSVFRSLRDQVQVSQVAKAYSEKYKVNLIDEFNTKLSEEEVKIIIDIVRELPAYRKT